MKYASLLPLALAACSAALPAVAQDALIVGAEVATDESRRGLSWSEGRTIAAADVFVSRGAFEASGRIVSTRNSDRHDGADAVVDVQAGLVGNAGPIQLRADITGHLFAGAASKMDYVEVGTNAAYSLGPLQLNAGALYAPEQSAIGGSNLYLYAGANAGIPLTPLTVSGQIGRSTGETDDPIRAARLRPLGSYSDWRLSLDYVYGPFTFGLDYVGTDVNRNAVPVSPFADVRHSGDRVIGRARLSF